MRLLLHPNMSDQPKYIHHIPLMWYRHLLYVINWAIFVTDTFQLIMMDLLGGFSCTLVYINAISIIQQINELEEDHLAKLEIILHCDTRALEQV